jgi:D-arabinose 1-dehydrogenase-like Zn-dependent alcohol dehydrogenase
MVVHENFGIFLPKTYPLEMAGPVMCAGITMYEPLKKANVKSGSKVGIVGLGGLGVMGVKIANALGGVVTVISRSTSKEDLARRSGASNFLVSTSDQQMKEAMGTLDLIINTVPSYHDYNIYTKLLNKTGKQVLLGLHKGMVAALIVNGITYGASKVASSEIGGIRNTQEVINLCDKHQIYPEIEILPCQDINKIYEKLDGNNESGVRYVLDIKNTLNEDTLAKCVDPAPMLKANASGFNICSILGECCGLFFCCRWR